MVIPTDVLFVILEYCCLKMRYRFSVLNKSYFPFIHRDWLNYGNCYHLKKKTRRDLQMLIQKNYRSQIYISRRVNSLWSNHLDSPLIIWSPWTVRRYSIRSLKKMDFYFREIRFVEFVRELGKRFGLKTKCLRKRDSDTCVVCTIWQSDNRRLPMLFYPSFRKRYNMHTFLKSYTRSRALIKFGVVQNQLILRVQKLEFWV